MTSKLQIFLNKLHQIENSYLSSLVNAEIKRTLDIERLSKKYDTYFIEVKDAD